MPWLPYDQNRPPKDGQKVRYRYKKSDGNWDDWIASGLGTGSLCNGKKPPDNIQWEIWWEEKELDELPLNRPKIGEIIRVKSDKGEGWIGAIGHVTKHENSYLAYIEWVKIPDKCPPNQWGFPNQHVELVSSVPDVPLEIDDRVIVEIWGDKEVTGTYLGHHGGEPLVYLNEPYHNAGSASWATAWHGGIAKVLKERGLDPNAPRCWKITPSQSRIVKVIKKEEKKMSEEKENQSFGKMLKQDFTNAAWRGAATQLTNAVQGAILLMLKDKGADENKIAVMKEILDTEYGKILIRAILGYSLTYMPTIGEDPRVQRLAEEFRVSAMDRSMEEVVGAASQYLMPAVKTAIAALPPIEEAVPEVLKSKKKKRVSHKTRVAEEQEVEETEQVAKKAEAP